MRPVAKRDLPVSNIRRLLGPGPSVLVSSTWQGASIIMTLGWPTVMEFDPPWSAASSPKATIATA